MTLSELTGGYVMVWLLRPFVKVLARLVAVYRAEKELATRQARVKLEPRFKVS